MSRLIQWALVLATLSATALMAQDASTSPTGTYVAQPIDSANASAAFAGLTLRLLGERWGLSNEDGDLVSGRYAVQADTLEIWDEDGRVACDSHLVGRYLWARWENVLRLSLLEDQCPGRRMAMTSMKFILRESRE
ncbi:MAG TPA: hypothetical protein VGA37_01985 [Gemmatimonadales bacterium]